MEELKYFFSYVRIDSEFVLNLAKELRAVGANVWLDQLDILGGQHWDSTVEKALKSSKGMIAVLSPESVASKNVMDEVSYALDEGKLVVPVLIRSCDIPYRLRRVQHIDFTADYDTGFSQLLRALGIEQPVQPVESAAAQEPSLPERPESAVGEEKEAEVRSKRQKTKVLAAICVVTLIAIVSIGVFFKYFKTYSLTATAGAGGAITPSGAISVKSEADQSFTMTPEDGYQIGDVLVDGISVGAVDRYTFTNVTADHKIAANFALKTYSLTVDAVDGSVTKSPDQASYNNGETVTLEAVPNKWYSFTNWSGDLSGSTNPTTLVMDAEKSVTASFDLKAGNVITNSIGMKLVSIPPGEFMMGSGDSAEQLVRDYRGNKSDFTNELPQHEVRISKGFWMGQTEVTQGQYESVMNAQPWSGQSYVQEGANNPAVYVSWDDAVKFCREQSQQEGKTYRLPTEAEWEYACRAGTATRFSFGNSDSSLGDYAWYASNTWDKGQKYAHPVGQKKSNPWNLYDMHGNVWEWCSDRYDKDYYSNSPSVDPKGPSSGTRRSWRGGAWDGRENHLRCSERHFNDPNARGHSLGFRVVCEQ